MRSLVTISSKFWEPCRLPLVRDPNYWPPRYDSTTMFRVEDLFNENMPNPELEDRLFVGTRWGFHGTHESVRYQGVFTTY